MTPEERAEQAAEDAHEALVARIMSEHEVITRDGPYGPYEDCSCDGRHDIDQDEHLVREALDAAREAASTAARLSAATQPAQGLAPLRGQQPVVVTMNKTPEPGVGALPGATCAWGHHWVRLYTGRDACYRCGTAR